METSILTSTKKILGVQEADTSFDPDISTHINSTLVIVKQLGLGPDPMIFIEDKEQTWDQLDLTPNQLNLCRSYVFLRVRMLFDPPTLSFLIDAISKQILEHEQRLSMERENAIPLPPSPSFRRLPVYDEFFYYYDEVIESL